MQRTLLLLGLFLVLATPSPAVAHLYWFSGAVKTAKRVQSPGCRPTIRWASLPGDAYSHEAGEARGGCYVLLDPQYTVDAGPAVTCQVLAHEFGHVSGLAHTSAPTDLMYPLLTATNMPSACLSFASSVSPERWLARAAERARRGLQH